MLFACLHSFPRTVGILLLLPDLGDTIWEKEGGGGGGGGKAFCRLS